MVIFTDRMQYPQSNGDSTECKWDSFMYQTQHKDQEIATLKNGKTKDI